MKQVGVSPCQEARCWRRSAEQVEWLMSLGDCGRLIHEPSRLAILTLLREHGRVGYLDISECTGLSKGNLSNHLAKLEKAGLTAVEKHFEGKKPVTSARLTEEGEESVRSYWASMNSISQGLGATEVEEIG